MTSTFFVRLNGNTFVQYFNRWLKNVAERPLPSSVTDRSSMLFRKSTEKGMIMTTKSMKEIVNVCLNADANFIMTRRLNQDPLESCFGQQRQR